MNSLKRKSRLAIAAGGLVILAACAEIVPILTSAAMAFGQNLVQTSAQNAGSKYGDAVEQLILALAYKTLEQTEQAVQQQYPSPYWGSYAGPGYTDQGGYDEYEDEGDYEEYGEYDESDESDPYADEYYSRSVKGVGPVQLDVALLAQQKLENGKVRLLPVADGDVLRDGRGDRLAGDKIKVAFKSNCECYVYVIGADAAGQIAQIFPDPDIPELGNPVQPDQKYMLPKGHDWWGLDEFRGVETIYFIASPRKRKDIEKALAQISAQSRSVSPQSYTPVSQAAVVPIPRGLVKVTDAPKMEITSQGGQTQQVQPLSFLATAQGADLVITRWFKHE